jgi:hypothetical protein
VNLFHPSSLTSASERVLVSNELSPGLFECGGPDHHRWATAEDASKCCAGYVRASRVTRDPDGMTRLEPFWRRETDAPDAAAMSHDGAQSADHDPPILPFPRATRPVAACASASPDAVDVSHLRHSALFVRLAGLESQESPDFKAWLGVLAVLRFVDRQIAPHDARPRFTLAEAHALERAIATIEDRRPRDITRALAAVSRETPLHIDAAVECLLTLGEWLEEGREWALAADVYETALIYEADSGAPQFVFDAYDRLGRCLRANGELNAALNVFRTGWQAAESAGDAAWTAHLREAESDTAALVRNGAVRPRLHPADDAPIRPDVDDG